MTQLGILLVAGIVAGLLGVAIAVLIGAGWGWMIGAYVFGGQAGLIMTGLLIARRAHRDDGLQANQD